MQKTILITGSTDGIGLETAKLLANTGHQILVHGRSPAKLAAVQSTLSGSSEIYEADLSKFDDVEKLAAAVREKHTTLDVLINNAGVFKTPNPNTDSGLDVRFVVNTLAPFLLTQRLLPLMGPAARIVNVSSAAQAPVNLDALAGHVRLADMEAYAQSKLAITMWTRDMAAALNTGPILVSVNPGSLLASKMVKEGFGVTGNDLSIGAEILARAALSEEFEGKSGAYFDNDTGRFADPHPDGLDGQKTRDVVDTIEAVLAKNTNR